MLLSKGNVKLRSLALSPLVLAAAVGVVGAASAGCFFVEDPTPPGDYTDPGQTDPIILDRPIAPDQALSQPPGEGVGIFVEYRSGGEWHIWTTCDTFTSKAVCSFDIFAWTDPTMLRSYATDQTEGYDKVNDLGNGEVEFIADTDSDIDRLILSAEPGAPLTIEVYLDGDSAQPFVYWVSDHLNEGAPSNPLRLVPMQP